MIEHTLGAIAELIYEDEIKEAETLLEDYTNQRVIEELEKQVDEYFKQPTEIDLSKRLKDRIQELKQER